MERASLEGDDEAALRLRHTQEIVLFVANASRGQCQADMNPYKVTHTHTHTAACRSHNQSLSKTLAPRNIFTCIQKITYFSIYIFTQIRRSHRTLSSPFNRVYLNGSKVTRAQPTEYAIKLYTYFYYCIMRRQHANDPLPLSHYHYSLATRNKSSTTCILLSNHVVGRWAASSSHDTSCCSPCYRGESPNILRCRMLP